MPFRTYRAKPVEVTAMQLTRENRDEIIKIIGEHNLELKSYDPINLMIRNEHGNVLAEPGDWIIKGSRGEFYPCKNATFVEKYEEPTQTSATGRR